MADGNNLTLAVPTGILASPADARSSFRSSVRGSVRRPEPSRKGKTVRINSIENLTTHLRDLRDEESAHGGHGGTSENRSATFDQLAMLYALSLTLFGFVFPLSNYVSVTPSSPWYLIVFYILLHLVALGFLIFILGWVLRRPPHVLFLPTEVVESEPDRSFRRAPVLFHVGGRDSVPSLHNNSGGIQDVDHIDSAPKSPGMVRIQLLVPGVDTDAAADVTDGSDLADTISIASTVRSSVFDTGVSTYSEATTVTTAKRRRRTGDRVNSTLLQNARELGVQEIPASSVLSLHESHSPSFFLRVACFIFGALKVTHEFLMIVDTLTDLSGGCAKSSSESVGLIIQYWLSICETVLQTFFIFKYSKLSVNFHRKVCVLGFMHLVATNMCVWFQAILLETSHSTVKSDKTTTTSSGNYSNYSYATTTASSATAVSSCSKDVFWRMAPYLFPFTIEYTLMAAFSSYTLYRNVSKFLDVIQAKGFNVAKQCLRNRKQAVTSFSASCYKTDKGFFLGAMLLVLGLISGIYFTVYVNDKPNDATTSQLIYLVTDVVLLAANLALCIFAYCQLRRLTLVHRVSTGPDSWLLAITLIGVLAFQLFQLFGASADKGAMFVMRVIQGLLAIVECVFQVFLVLDGEKRRSKTDAVIEEKPGREAIAALLLGNIALWVVYTLEIREVNNLPNYSQTYVPVASSIFTYVCSPLIIFFRFHSACCFVEIWRTAYKGKKKTGQRCRSHSDLSVASAMPDFIHGLGGR